MRAVSDALIERVAAAVAPLGYRDLQLDDAAGLLLVSDYSSDLAPFALELTAVHEDVDRDGYQEELALGLCRGSGYKPYQTVVDLGEPAFECSTPARRREHVPVIDAVLRVS